MGVMRAPASRERKKVVHNRLFGRHIDDIAMAEIDRIAASHVRTPIGPEFMAPPSGPPLRASASAEV
jgi:hypothetical protein